MLNILFRSNILVVIVIILRILLRRFLPQRIWVYLWLVVMLRFLIPCNFRIWVQEIPVYGNGEINYLHSVEGFITQSAKAFIIVWATGAFCCLFYFFKKYYKEIKLLKEAIPYDADRSEAISGLLKSITKRKIKIVVSDRVTAPMTYGILCPVIVLSKECSLQEDRVLKYVMIHEVMHITHLDHLLKMLSVLVVSIFWFDALAWIVFCLLAKDIELACDENVLSFLGENQKKAYALSLLTVKAGSVPFFSLPNRFGKKNLTERVEHIMRFKKLKVSGLIFSVVLIGAVSIGSFVSADSSSDLYKKVNAYQKAVCEKETDFADNSIDTAKSVDAIDGAYLEEPDLDTEKVSEPWYKSYYPDLTDEEIELIESIHAANRKMIMEDEMNRTKMNYEN